MLNFFSKKCLCKVDDCGKCLTIHCADDNCNIHKIITKLRYRKRLLVTLKNKKDVKTCEEEIKSLNKVLDI